MIIAKVNADNDIVNVAYPWGMCWLFHIRATPSFFLAVHNMCHTKLVLCNTSLHYGKSECCKLSSFVLFLLSSFDVLLKPNI